MITEARDIIVSLDRAGKTDEALRLLFRTVDQWASAGRAGGVGALVGAIAPEEVSVDLAVGILSATFPMRHLIDGERAAFVRKAGPRIKRELGKIRAASILRRLG